MNRIATFVFRLEPRLRKKLHYLMREIHLTEKYELTGAVHALRQLRAGLSAGSALSVR
jgi:hypothetical protein